MEPTSPTLSKLPERCLHEGCKEFIRRATIEVNYPLPTIDSGGQSELSPAHSATVKYVCHIGHVTPRTILFK